MVSPHAPPEWLKPNALVLAKMGQYPHWPARVCYEFDEKLGKRWRMVDDDGRTLYWCVFLNDYTGYWIERAMVKPYSSQAALDSKTNDDRSAMSAEEKVALDGAFEEGVDRYEESFMPPIEREEIREGDLVIAFHDAFPPWPCVVELADDSGANDERNAWCNDTDYHCKFLGDEPDYNWVPHEHVIKYTKNRMECYKVGKSNKLYHQYNVAKKKAEKEDVKSQLEEVFGNNQDDSGGSVNDSHIGATNRDEEAGNDAAQSAIVRSPSQARRARARRRGRNEANASRSNNGAKGVNVTPIGARTRRYDELKLPDGSGSGSIGAKNGVDCENHSGGEKVENLLLDGNNGERHGTHDDASGHKRVRVREAESSDEEKLVEIWPSQLSNVDYDALREKILEIRASRRI